ncbi:hypothetical protein [Hyalangium sp.]|nr:hypothetical protein [Hyalangium sp.]HYI02246.1 hypothetical protein [Hyalangium sp.]
MKIPDSSAPSSLRKFAGPLVTILALWGVMGFVVLAELFPYRPSTPLGW